MFLLVRCRVAPYEVLKPQREKGGLKLLGDRRLRILVIANMLWMGSYSLWTNWTTSYLTYSFPLTVKSVAPFAWIPPVAATCWAHSSAAGCRAKPSHAGSRTPTLAGSPASFISAFGCSRDPGVAVPACRSPYTATAIISASYFWATAGSVNVYTLPVDIWGGERAGTAISALVFGYGILQTGISPLIGFIVDHKGYAPACWLVGLTPIGAWWLLRTLR